MNTLIFGLKREYWETKKLLVTVPLIVTALFFLMAIVATWNHHSSDTWLTNMGADNTESVTVSSAVDTQSSDKRVQGQGETEDESFWFSGVYLAAAWLSAMFYALSSLFNDRRDKSILYWKTMPVSDLQTVFTKYVFAIFGFSIIAIVISWLSAAVLISYSYLVFPPEMLADDTAGMSFKKLIIWPVMTTLIAFFWCAPVFALLLYVSSRAKKMPALIFLIGVIVLKMLESIVFSSDLIAGFLYQHSPLGLLSHISEMDNTIDIFNKFFLQSFASLVLGLCIACLFIWRAAWRRDHDFEID